MRCLGHRRRGIHRLEPGRRAARPRRRGDGRRRPLDRPAREPRRGAGGRRASWSSSTSATARRWRELARRGAPGGRLPPGGPDRRPQVGRRPRLRRLDQRRRHRQRARGGARRRGARRASSSSPPAARSTARARARSCRSTRARRSRRSPPTARASSPPRATWRSTSGSTGSPASSLRLGNVYGPRQDPLGEAGVIAIFCGKLRGGRAADRLRRRHADPRLHICGRRGRARRWPRRSRRRRGAINIGTGIETDVLELAARAAASSAARGLRARARPAPRPARCSGSRSTPAAPSASWAGGPRPASTRACA